MFLILTNNLNENELLIIDRLFSRAKIDFYKILNVSKNTKENLPDKEILSKYYIVLVHNKTKTKSSFIKTLEELYGDFFINYDKVINIETPDSFMKNEKSREDVWNTIKKLRENITVSDVYFSVIPEELPEDLKEMIKNKSTRKIYVLNNGISELEIRPEEIKPTRKNSLTYEEFVILVCSRMIFPFDKAQIFSN